MTPEDYQPPRVHRIYKNGLEFVPIDQFIREQKADLERELARQAIIDTQYAQPVRFIGAFMLTLDDVQFLYQCGVLVD